VKVTVSNISDPGGLDVKVEPGKGWVRSAVERAVEAPGNASGTLLFIREGSRVTVTGSLDVTSSLPCERCLEAVPLALDVDVDLIFVPASQAPSAHIEVELEENDLDVGYFENDELSVEDLVCEAIALEMPTRIVCDDELACDERTARLLAGRGAAGPTDEHPFAALKGRFH
jgi:uncharacterized metal-binding protein YceD (DUF177 family)